MAEEVPPTACQSERNEKVKQKVPPCSATSPENTTGNDTNWKKRSSNPAKDHHGHICGKQSMYIYSYIPSSTLIVPGNDYLAAESAGVWAITLVALKWPRALLCSITEQSNLTSLHLYGNEIGDAGAAHLSALGNLTSLDLQYNKIGDAGAAHLAAISDLTCGWSTMYHC